MRGSYDEENKRVKAFRAGGTPGTIGPFVMSGRRTLFAHFAVSPDKHKHSKLNRLETFRCKAVETGPFGNFPLQSHNYWCVLKFFFALKLFVAKP